MTNGNVHMGIDNMNYLESTSNERLLNKDNNILEQQMQFHCP